MTRKVAIMLMAVLYSSSCLKTENKAMNVQLHQDSKDWAEGTELFFLLLTQELVLAEKTPPTGFYVKGTFQNKKFKPTSQILGIGELATSGRYGWLELNSKEFFPMESDRKAESPFVKGYMMPQGFVPSVREVITTP
jgi:hypothetical protein